MICNSICNINLFQTNESLNILWLISFWDMLWQTCSMNQDGPRANGDSASIFTVDRTVRRAAELGDNGSYLWPVATLARCEVWCIIWTSQGEKWCYTVVNINRLSMMHLTVGYVHHQIYFLWSKNGGRDHRHQVQFFENKIEHILKSTISRNCTWWQWLGGSILWCRCWDRVILRPRSASNSRFG